MDIIRDSKLYFRSLILFINFESVKSYFSNSGKRNLFILTRRSENWWGIFEDEKVYR